MCGFAATKEEAQSWVIQPCKLCVMRIIVNSVRIDVGRLWIAKKKKKKDKSVINTVTSLDAQMAAQKLIRILFRL